MELQATEVVKPEADQACGSHNQINMEDEAIGNLQFFEKNDWGTPIVIREKYLLKMLESLKQATEKPVKSRIQRVPYMLRENKELKKYCRPSVVAIGPIHHGHPNFEYGEKMKLILASNFLESHGIDAKVVYRQVYDNLAKLNMCYAEDVRKHFSDEALAWMFLVDGCATLHLIDCFVQDYPEHTDDGKLQRMNITKEQVAFAGMDIFLLENQLPYELLELLISSVVGQREQEIIRVSISEFISLSNIFLKSARKSRKEATPPCHLLDLLREEILANFEKTKMIKPANIINEESPTFHNVKQLKVSGIQFKPSYTGSLEISFQQGFFPKLRLPAVIIDELFFSKVLSLASYEKCPDFLNDKEVTSYICFMDSLIDHPDDVKVLRKSNILMNIFGSDEEIAQLFTRLGNELLPNPFLYANVRYEIEQHYKKTWQPWIYGVIKVFYDYWAMLKVGAVIAILLTVVQTYFSLPLHRTKP